MIDKLEKESLLKEKPILNDIVMLNEVLWMNPNKGEIPQTKDFSLKEMKEASDRLHRFSSYINSTFPETAPSGEIESPLLAIPHMKKYLEGRFQIVLAGQYYLKCDHLLPIAGSIKARGGIYEVLKYAETLALDAGMLNEMSNYGVFASNEMKSFLSQYSIAVGSTGNLGLSIGIMSAELGFRVTVHMSSDAKQWKKDLLREKGVEVIEYLQDYSTAVEMGRKAALTNPNCHFVDDENSKDLFAGYSVAAFRLKKQLDEQGILIDTDHPLFVYLPCGVGGGPGGIAFGLHMVFGEAVHIFFAEPTHSPCMLLGMITGLHDNVSVQDFGLDNVTEADGLAVGRASGFVGRVIEPILSGCYTVDDAFLFESLRHLYEIEGEFLEPSAHAGMLGPVKLMQEGKSYIEKNHLKGKMANAIHIIWSTGGSLVPEQLRKEYLEK